MKKTIALFLAVIMCLSVSVFAADVKTEAAAEEPAAPAAGYDPENPLALMPVICREQFRAVLETWFTSDEFQSLAGSYMEKSGSKEYTMPQLQFAMRYMARDIEGYPADGLFLSLKADLATEKGFYDSVVLCVADGEIRSTLDKGFRDWCRGSLAVTNAEEALYIIMNCVESRRAEFGSDNILFYTNAENYFSPAEEELSLLNEAIADIVTVK